MKYKPKLKLVPLLICTISLTLAAEVITHTQVCSRAIKSVLPHTRHSTATLNAWKQWGTTHPNWKPKTRTETLIKFNEACMVEPDDQTATNLIPIEPITEFIPEIQDDSLQTVQIESVPSIDYGQYDMPQDVADLGHQYQTIEGSVGPVYFPIVGTTIPATVPEPATLLLLGTGLFFLAVVGLMCND